MRDHHADIHWDKNKLPISTRFDDVYFSKHSGLDESKYVFLEQNNLSTRWQQLKTNEQFIIAETGFGTGLNFLLTWQAWIEHHNNQNTFEQNNTLHFYSVEKYPLKLDDLKKALSLWPELNIFNQKLLDAYPPHTCRGLHKIQFDNKVTLTLYLGEVTDGLQALLPIVNPGPEVESIESTYGINNPAVNAWYLDGFAPAKNPGMWRDDVFKLMNRLSRPTTSFATFTAAGKVRRGLEEHGFNCRKTKGFGTKREMLCGELKSTLPYRTLSTPSAKQEPLSTSWHLQEKPELIDQPIASALVIGGGLAGCHTAWALAQRGIKVTILEQKSKLAQGGSGNKRGIIYTRLSPHNDPLSVFNLHSLLFACHFYKANGFFPSVGEQCGVLHLAQTKKANDYYKQLLLQFSEQENFLHWVEKEETQGLSNFQLDSGGLFLPRAGWLDPALLCIELSKHKNISTIYSQKIHSLVKSDSNWHALNEPGEVLHSADIAIIANAHEAQALTQSNFLPVNKIRGQVTYIESGLKRPLRTTVCSDGYMAQVGDRGLCVGASFNLDEEQLHLSQQEHAHNLEKLARFGPEFQAMAKSVEPGQLDGRAAFRCVSPDYFPIVGPVPQLQAFSQDFAVLGKKANAQIDKCGIYHEGLFTLLALGSRGLAYAPIAADTLASMICGEPPPLSLQLYLHVHPARFIIRDLIRNKPIKGLH